MTEKRKILISIETGILSAAVLFFLLIWPLVNKINQTSSDILETRKQIFIVEEKNKLSKKIEANAKRAAEAAPKIESSLFDPDKIFDLAVILEDSAAQTGNQFSIGESAEQGKFFSLSINLWGSFANLARFLKKLENLPYLTQIDNLNIRKLEPQEVVLRNQSVGPAILPSDISTVIKFRVFTK